MHAPDSHIMIEIQRERDSSIGGKHNNKSYINSVDACIGSTRRFVIRKFTRWLCENHHVLLLTYSPSSKTLSNAMVLEKIHSKKLPDKNYELVAYFRFRQYSLNSQISRVFLVQDCRLNREVHH